MEPNWPGEEVSTSGHTSPGTDCLGLAIDQVGDSIVITDQQGTILYVNSAFTSLTGYSSQEVVGQNPRLLKSGQQDPGYYRELWTTIQAGRTWRGMLINQRKDGSTYTEEMTITPVRDARGEIVRHIALKRDVTQRLAAEETQKLLAAILASSEDAIIGKKLDGTIQTWNHGAEVLFGYRTDEIIGRPISLLWPSGPSPDSIQESIRTGQRCHFETVLTTKDGRPIAVLLTGFPIKNAQGEVTGSATIARDNRAYRTTQETLRESEAKYRTIFQVSRDALLIADGQTGMLLDANPAAIAMLGRPLEEIRKLHQTQVHASEDAASGRASFERTRRESAVMDHVVLRADGQRIPVEIAASPLRDARGRELVLGIFHDLTERQRSEEELRETEERFRIMADGCPIIVWVTDAEGGNQFVNRTYLEYFGVTYEQVEGAKWQPLIHPDDAPQHLAAFLLATEEHSAFTAEARVRRADGEWRWIASNAAPRFSTRNEFLGHVGVSIDITERRQAEQALRASEEKFRQLAENVRDAFWMSNVEGTEMLYVSPVYEEIWGHSKEELYRNPMAWFEAIVPEDRDRVRAAFHTQPLTHAVIAEYRIRTPSGELKWVRDRAFPIRDGDGQVHRIVGISEDITESKEAAAEMIRAREAAEAANRAKSEFLANMSHEIRTPIHGVLGLAQLALAAETLDESRSHIETLHGAAEGLLNVINDVLDFSKIEAGKLTLAVVPFSLPQLIDNVRKLIAPQANAKGLKLDCNTTGDLPCVLAGDPVRLRQVLVNLLGNAVKFTSSGSIAVTVSPDSVDYSANRATLRFRVSDTGVGIPPDRQQAIFEAFEQADSSITREFGGTGLGLTICSQIVQLMGGRIWVESTAGAGSTFQFTCKLGMVETSSLAQLRQHVEEPGPPLRIMLAEDNLINQKIAVAMLGRHNHQVTIASTGREALEIWEAGEFDVILMDNQMPEMGGIEAVRILRAREAASGRQRVPVIALTASSMIGDRERFLAAGMDAYLAKPFRADELYSVLREATSTPSQAGSRQPSQLDPA
ncbi:MAG TPA: PAS domain S-box protein [Bryobacteraceae bacterium]|nr:PAS domain S-box protein [Bryobacteraceae bacterium]